MVKTVFSDCSKSINKLQRENVPHIILDIDTPFRQALTVFPEDEPLPCPGAERLSAGIQVFRKQFGIELGTDLESEREQGRCLAFSRAVRELFMSELVMYLQQFDTAFRKAHTDDFYVFVECFLKLHSDEIAREQNCKIPEAIEEERLFVQALTNSQCFAGLFDELCGDEQGNYARLQAMKKRAAAKLTASGAKPPEFVAATFASNEHIVMSRLGRVFDPAANSSVKKSMIAMKNKEREEQKTSPYQLAAKLDPVILKVKVDWRVQLRKLSEVLLNAPPTGKESKELELEEVKCDSSALEYLSPPVKRQSGILSVLMKRRGPVVYGPGGLLSFLDETLVERPGEKPDMRFFDYVNASLMALSDPSYLLPKGQPPFLELDASSYQFSLFCATYYSAYQQPACDIVKHYMDAYNRAKTQLSFHSVFPLMSFKRHVQQLDFEVLRQLLACSGDVILSPHSRLLADVHNQGRARRETVARALGEPIPPAKTYRAEKSSPGRHDPFRPSRPRRGLQGCVSSSGPAVWHGLRLCMCQGRTRDQEHSAVNQSERGRVPTAVSAAAIYERFPEGVQLCESAPGRGGAVLTVGPGHSAEEIPAQGARHVRARRKVRAIPAHRDAGSRA